jgi:RecG-like helicase
MSELLSKQSHDILFASVASIKGVGPKAKEKLERIGIVRLWDLLLHLPMRYEDRTRYTDFSRLIQGQAALISGEIHHVKKSQGGRKSLQCQLRQGHQQLTLRFFHYYPQFEKQFQTGMHVHAFWVVRKGFQGLEMGPS